MPTEAIQLIKGCMDAKKHRGVVGFVEKCFGEVCQKRPVMLNLIQHLSISIDSINIDRLRVCLVARVKRDCNAAAFASPFRPVLDLFSLKTAVRSSPLTKRYLIVLFGRVPVLTSSFATRVTLVHKSALRAIRKPAMTERLFSIGERENISCAKRTVTNLFPYSPIHLLPSKRVAFTLAEVLITLGIIGIVAAITMPTLIQNHKNQVYVNQLKKTYSVLSQGFQLMLADDGVDKLPDTQVWNAKGDTYCSYEDDSYLTETNCKSFVDNLKKYFKISEFVQYGDVLRTIENTVRDNNFGNYYAASLPDGSMIFLDAYDVSTETSSQHCNWIKNSGGHLCSKVGHLYIDVNGKKRPNVNGKDVFCFVISDDGKLYPRAGADYALFKQQKELENNTTYWRTNKGWCGIPGGEIKCETQTVTGDGCQARIMENSWKMDY